MSIFTKDLANLKAAVEGIGFDTKATPLGATTPADLEAHVETLIAEAVAGSTEQVTTLSADLSAAKELLEASTQANETQGKQLETYAAGIKAAGVKLEEADLGDESKIAATITQRASILAAEQLAAKGFTEAMLEDSAQQNPSKPSANQTLKGSAKAIAHWNNK